MNPLLKQVLVDGAFVIDNSSFEMLTTCPRSALYYILMKRRTAAKRSALNFGGAVHAGLEIRYKDELGIACPTKDLLTRQVQASMDYFTKNSVDGDEFRTPQRCVEVLEAYNEKYASEPFSVVHLLNGTKACELSFAVPIGEVQVLVDQPGGGPSHYITIPCVWTGKVDVAIEWENGLWVMDHKTTSILGDTYFNQFYNSNQMIGYCWALSHVLDKPVRGALMNVLAIRRPTKTGKSIEFVRQRFEYPQARIEEWQTNTLQILEDFFHMCSKDYFPMHTQWCIGKFGQCPYFDVCTVPTDQREFMLQSGLYEEVDWSPLKKD